MYSTGAQPTVASKAYRQRCNPTYYELLAVNKLTAANLRHSFKFALSTLIYDLFIPDRCLLIDINKDEHEQQLKARLAQRINLTYISLNNTEAADIATLIRSMPKMQGWYQKNKEAFATTTRLVHAARIKANNNGE